MDIFKNLANAIGGKQATSSKQQSRPKQRPVQSGSPTVQKECNAANLLLHRSALPDIKMRKAYDRILAGLESWEGSIRLSSLTNDEVSSLYTGVQMDNHTSSMYGGVSPS